MCGSPFDLQRPSPLPSFNSSLFFLAALDGHLPFFFTPTGSTQLFPLLLIKKIMTPALDCIETAADRIKQDEFLADKKRVMSFFVWVSLTLFHPMTPLTYATVKPVRIVQTRQSPAIRTVLSFQETFSFTFPFSQCFRCIYFVFPVPSSFYSFSWCLTFVFWLHFFAVTAKFHSCCSKARIPPPSLFIPLHSWRLGGSYGRFSSGFSYLHQ